MLWHIRFRCRGIFVFLARVYYYNIRARERPAFIPVHRPVVDSFSGGMGLILLNLRLLRKKLRFVKITVAFCMSGK